MILCLALALPLGSCCDLLELKELTTRRYFVTQSPTPASTEVIFFYFGADYMIKIPPQLCLRPTFAKIELKTFSSGFSACRNSFCFFHMTSITLTWLKAGPLTANRLPGSKLSRWRSIQDNVGSRTSDCHWCISQGVHAADSLVQVLGGLIIAKPGGLTRINGCKIIPLIYLRHRRNISPSVSPRWFVPLTQQAIFHFKSFNFWPLFLFSISARQGPANLGQL